MSVPFGLEPLQNYLVPASGTTHGYRFTETMESGKVYEISFRDFQLNGRPFAPSGVLIDNTRGDADVSVIINEVSYRIVCKKGEFLHLPYPAPLQQTVTLQGEGLTTIIFVDYPVLPFSSATNSGGGGGGGNTGRSTMFHGFQGQAAVTALTAGVAKTLNVLSSTVDTDAWQSGANLVVPAGVEMVRVTLTTQLVTGADRGSGFWDVGSGNIISTQSVAGDPMAQITIDFGVFAVNPGDTLPLTCNPNADSAAAGGILTVEVVQGAILNT